MAPAVLVVAFLFVLGLALARQCAIGDAQVARSRPGDRFADWNFDEEREESRV